jgi:preprotein translocase subunit SecG
MINIIIGLHVTVCFFLIFVVLLQRGKGADMGAVFGGSTNTILGATGAVSLLHRLTTAAAIIFMCSSLYLAWHSSQTESAVAGSKMLKTEDVKNNSEALPTDLTKDKKAPAKKDAEKKPAKKTK